VGERDVAELIHERVHLGLSPLLAVLLFGEPRAVDVGLALALPREQSLLVEAGQHGHVGGVGTRVAVPSVEPLHHIAYRALLERPHRVHDLRLELVEPRRRCFLASAARHLLRSVTASFSQSV